jgi:colicin import membrane protein
MIRKHENAVSVKAGALAFTVHAVLLIAMIVSINWKAAHPPMQVTEVTLWDQLPNKNIPKPVEVKETPKPKEPPKPIEPPKPVESPKPEPKPEVKHEANQVDIALEKKKQALAKAKEVEEKRGKEKQEKDLAEKMRLEDLKLQKPSTKPASDAAIKKLQQDMLNDDLGENRQQASAASASLVSEFTDKIKAKVRGNVNKTLCGEGNPELQFDISLLPTGDLLGNPKLLKSSGNIICDEAVERAILASEPFPLPSEAAAKAKFRNLKLKFRPNEPL